MKEDVVLFVHVCFYVQVFACTVFMCVCGGEGGPRDVYVQWRMQEFPEVGAPTLRGGGGTNIRFCQIPPQMHEIEIIRAPLRSANGVV